MINFGRGFIAKPYTADTELSAIATSLFTLGAVFQIADVKQLTVINVLRRHKNTKILMLITLFSFWCVFATWFYPLLLTIG